MKGLLCSKDGSVVLGRNSMTIGRHDCDINIEDPRMESCHAVLEFCDEKQCYVLRDLNTPNGTYVNDCKIQNNGIYIAHGDIIRFGEGGKQYELRLTEKSETMVPVGGTQRPFSSYATKTSLPEIHYKRHQIKPFALPHPPSRPRSACEFDRIQNLTRSAGSPQITRQAWDGNLSLENVSSPKLHSIIQMIDELGSLNGCTEKNARRCAILNELRNEVSQMYKQESENKMAASQNLAHNLYHMERELEDRRSEISLLRQQLDSVMQTNPTMTSQIAEKEKQIHELRLDLDKSKREYSMSQGLVQSLQREMTVKEAEIRRKNLEIGQMKKTIRDKDIQFQSLSSKFVRVHDCRNKDEALNSVNEEMKTLKQKIRRLESRSGDHTSLIQRYKNEITQLNEMVKKLDNEKESLVKKAEEQKGKYLELQRSERLLRVDVEQAKSRITRFRGKMTRILYSASGVRAPDYPDDAEDSRMIVDLETIIDERGKDKDFIRSLQNKVQTHEDLDKKREESLTSLKDSLEELLTSLQTNGHHIDILQNQRRNLTSIEMEDSMKWIGLSLSEILKSEEAWLSEIYTALRNADYNVEVAEKSPGYFVEKLHKDFLEKQRALEELEAKLVQIELKHEDDIKRKTQEMMENSSEALATQIEKMRMLEREEREKALEMLRADLEEKHGVKLLEIGETLGTANNTIEELKESLAARDIELEKLTEKLDLTEQSLEQSKNNATALEEDLKTVLLQQKEARKEESNKGALAKKEFDKEVAQYKEEIRQHSITIVQMEERIQGIMKQLKDAQEEAEKLRAELRESDQAKHRLAPSPPVVVPPVIDISGYEQTIAMLRSELVASQTQLHLQQTDIMNLQRDLASAQARISDMKGELSEPLKEQLENGHRTIREKELENAKLREELHRMNKLVDRQKSEIHGIREELKGLKQAVVVSHNVEEEEKKAEATCDESPLHNIEKLDVGTQESRSGRINAELASQGAECRGERHSEVITRQREALAELRARIKALENAQPISPGNEEIVQQVILLKKELAEIRARQVMENDSNFRDQLSFSHRGDASARDIAPTDTKPIDAEIERTARLQLEDTVNMSEQSYMDVCNVVGGLLNINSMKGMRSANHLPVDERQKLAEDRRQDLESISHHIKSISNRLERKDNLLQNYDKDLAKLREAEEKATQKTAKVSVLLDEITTKTDENAHLREALRRTEERLNQEKRLNSAIKEKKTFHLENLDHRDPPPKHGECLRYGLDEESNAQKKKDKSQMMKKEYEIQVLRQKLRSQEQELCQASAQAANLMHHGVRRNVRSKTSSDSSSTTSSSSRSSHSRSVKRKDLA